MLLWLSDPSCGLWERSSAGRQTPAHQAEQALYKAIPVNKEVYARENSSCCSNKHPYLQSPIKKRFCVEGLALGPSLAQWKSLCCLFRRRRVERLPGLRCCVGPSQAFPIFCHSCWRCGLCFWQRFPCSCCAKLPCGDSCQCCVTLAASLTYKEFLKRRGGEANVWSRKKGKGISRKQQAQLQQTNGWGFRSPLV